MTILAPFMELAGFLGFRNRARRIVAVVTGLIAVALLCGALWAVWANFWNRHDDGVRQADRDATSVEVLNRSIAADRGAGAAQRERDEAIAGEQAELKEKTDAAHRNRTSPIDALVNEL